MALRNKGLDMQANQVMTPALVSLRMRAYLYFFNGDGTGAERSGFSRFIFYLILLNLVALLFESAPGINDAYQHWFYLFDIFSIFVFSAEYLLRLYVAPDTPEFSKFAWPRVRYATSFLGVLDLIAILPFFLGLLLAVDARVMRVLRLLRILKVTYFLSAAIKDFRRLNAGRTFRQKIHAALFDSEQGGKLYHAVEMFLIFWIVISVLSIVFESVDGIRTHFSLHFFILDAASFVVFATEYCLRVYAYPEELKTRNAFLARTKFMTSFGGLLDLVAILPFMLEMLLGNFVDLRFLRIVRMVRLLKLGRYSSASDTMFAVIKKEAPVLMASSFVMGLLVFITAALGYTLERDAQPDKFENIPQALYWAVITLASVGYGDISPITPGGRLVTVILALVGIGIFAIPAAIMASGFTDQLRMNREQLKLDLLLEIQGKELNEANIEAFTQHAKNKNLTDREIRELLEQSQEANTENDVRNEQHDSLILASKNNEYALAHYRILLSRLQALVSVADNKYIQHQLQADQQSNELERNIWQELNRSRPKSGQ